MGNTQSEIDDLNRRQTELERKTETEKKELWDKWLSAEKERKVLHEARLQEERANREQELKRQEEAMKIELKEVQESLRTEQLGREQAMWKAMEVEEQMEAQIIQEDERTSVERKIEEINKLRDELKTLKPGDSIEFPEESITLPKKLNVGLFGTTGIGKSSLVNSLKFAIKGELTELTMEQTSPATFHGGHSVRRLEVGITKYLTFIDNRGVGAEDLANIDAANEIISQLEGRSSFADKVNWRKKSSSKKTPVNENERIYCTVLVFDAQNAESVYTVLNKLVKEIFEWQGRYPIGVITHVDLATPDQLENMYVVLNSAGLVDTYEVANITSDSDIHDRRMGLSLDHQLNLLRLMKRCIKEGDRIFSLREQIERQEVQQAEEREREVEEERQKQARMKRKKEEARQAQEAEEAKIEKEKEAKKAIIEKEKEAEEARIEKEREKATQEKIEKVTLDLTAKFEKEMQARKAKENQNLCFLAVFIFVVIVWFSLK